jgi:hypothetical protein
MSEIFWRFLIGGTVVSIFAMLGGVFKPRTFAGLFGAAPSIALATLALAYRKDGSVYAGIEGRSMIVGALALLAYAVVLWFLIGRLHTSLSASKLVSFVALGAMPVWFAGALGLWYSVLR